MKNYLYSTMMMVAMMVAALSFIACGGSDDDEDDRGGTSSSELVGIWDLKTVENFLKVKQQALIMEKKCGKSHLI